MIVSRPQFRRTVEKAARDAMALGLSASAVDAAVAAAYPASPTDRYAAKLWFQEVARARPLWRKPRAEEPRGLFDTKGDGNE